MQTTDELYQYIEMDTSANLRKITDVNNFGISISKRLAELMGGTLSAYVADFFIDDELMLKSVK